ncbi:MAG: hypothetical protein AAB922_00385 [Patescibacteria group bacterium]
MDKQGKFFVIGRLVFLIGFVTGVVGIGFHLGIIVWGSGIILAILGLIPIYKVIFQILQGEYPSNIKQP